MKLDQTRLPLLEAIDKYNYLEPAYFCVPGHRFERGVPEPLTERFGNSMFKYDLTETDGLDDLHDPSEAIAESLELAADLFGTDRTWFTVNGTTSAIMAMILSTTKDGDEIIIARNAHVSALNGIRLSGAKPVWVLPEYDEEWGFFKEITPDTIKSALETHENAKAVLIVSPTYYGSVSDVESIANICHERGVPLLVDEAHGTHLGFSDKLPKGAIEAGADLVAQSIHKTGGAMTQSSMLHYQGIHKIVEKLDEESGQVMECEEIINLVDADRIDSSLKMLMSTSPSYVLMSSLDAARWQLANQGEEMAASAIETAEDLRRGLSEIVGIKVFGGDDPKALLDNNIDITRVVFSAAGVGLSGTELKDRIHNQGMISLEMADGNNCVAVITGANNSQEVLQLIMAAWKASSTANGEKTNFVEAFNWEPEVAITPREAYFLEAEEIPFKEAIGRISAVGIAPYPPGIPVINPGEIITKRVYETLKKCEENGIPFHGAKDLNTIKVIKVKE